MLARVTLCILCLTALSLTPSSAALVELREDARLEEEERIRFGHVAQIAAPEDGADALVDKLEEVDLGPSPLPGSSRRLTAGYIKMRLRRSGVNCGDLTFAGADAVTVHRAAPRPPAADTSEEECDETGMPAPDLPAPVEVGRGTRVHLTVVSGAITIGAEATLLEGAVVGGRAMMRVQQTRETVTAELIGPTEAIIRESEAN